MKNRASRSMRSRRRKRWLMLCRRRSRNRRKRNRANRRRSRRKQSWMKD